MVFEIFNVIFELPVAEDLFVKTDVNTNYPVHKNKEWTYLLGVCNMMQNR